MLTSPGVVLVLAFSSSVRLFKSLHHVSLLLQSGSICTPLDLVSASSGKLLLNSTTFGPREVLRFLHCRMTEPLYLSGPGTESGKQ